MAVGSSSGSSSGHSIGSASGSSIEFSTEFDPAYGVAVTVAPGLRRVVAENPSKYTAWGTGTYIVGDDAPGSAVAVIDPGPDLDDHVAALLAAVEGQRVTHVLITHTHGDHSPAAAALAAATGATTYGFGPHPEGAVTEGEAVGDKVAEGEAVEGEAVERGVTAGEHSDLEFVPDVVVRDGDVITGEGFEFECLHTPGHISNHVCFAERRLGALFSGDHVMGWSTSVISPPDGSITDYLANLERLLARDESVYYPTHGPPITDPQRYVASLIAHRRDRERQIIVQLALGPRTVEEIVAVLYADVRAELHAPAARSVLAHLIALEQQGVAAPLEAAGSESGHDQQRWAIAGHGA